MRKSIAIALAFLLALAMGATLAGCGSGDTALSQTLQVRRVMESPGVGIAWGAGIPSSDVADLTQLLEANGIAALVIPVVQFHGQLIIEDTADGGVISLALYGIAPEHGFLLGEDVGSLRDDVIYIYRSGFEHGSMDLRLSIVTDEGEDWVESAEAMHLRFDVETTLSPYTALLPAYRLPGDDNLLYSFVTLDTLLRLTGYMYAREFEHLNDALALQGMAAPRIARVYVHVEHIDDIAAARRHLTDNGFDVR